MAKAEFTVAVEKAVHDVLGDLAKLIWGQHGICLQSVRFSWVDSSTNGESNMMLIDVETSTLTKY